MGIENEIVQKHEELVAELAKPGEAVLASLTPHMLRVWMQAVQVAVSQVEMLSEAKKCAIYEADPTQKLKDYVAFTRLPAGRSRVEEMSPEHIDLLHAATGIATEALELLESVLHGVIVGYMDADHFIEEMGDLEFYMQQARQNRQVERNETLRVNYGKLRKRYPKGYTNEAAIERADKK